MRAAGARPHVLVVAELQRFGAIRVGASADEQANADLVLLAPQAGDVIVHLAKDNLAPSATNHTQVRVARRNRYVVNRDAAMLRHEAQDGQEIGGLLSLLRLADRPGESD